MAAAIHDAVLRADLPSAKVTVTVDWHDYRKLMMARPRSSPRRAAEALPRCVRVIDEKTKRAPKARPIGAL